MENFIPVNEPYLNGNDFQSAQELAISMAHDNALTFIPSFDPLLVIRFATYSLELLKAVKVF